MKYLATLAIAFLPFISTAQVVGGMDFKLEKLYMDEKWEDLGYKALNMMEKDKWKKDPEVYLYASMAFYHIKRSDDEKLKEAYPKALFDAVKYAWKFRIKDKENTWYQDNIDYFEDLKEVAIADAMIYVDDQRKRRMAVTGMKNLNKAVPEDYNILFFKGVLEMLNRNEGESERNIKEAMDGLITAYDDPRYKPSRASAPVLEDGLVRWADILIEKSYVDSARKTLDTYGMKFFPESEKIRTKSESIALKKK